MISIFYRKQSLFFFAIKFFLFKFKLFKNPMSSGPQSVKDNLIKGLNKYRIKYNVNPGKESIYRTCLVLNCAKYLRFCINQKKQKKIRHIVAGPNIVTLPSDFNNIIFSKEIDVILVPSKWVKNIYLKFNKKCKNILVWFVGTEIQKIYNKKKIFVTVIIKKKIDTLIINCIKYLKSKFFRVKIIKYGYYNQKKYFNFLQKSFFTVHFLGTESQGLSMLESWAHNVPTIVLKQRFWYFDNKKFKASSSPYLNKQCGLFFSNLLKFKKVVNNIHKYNFEPQKWLRKNMSQKKSIELLINTIKSIR